MLEPINVGAGVTCVGIDRNSAFKPGDRFLKLASPDVYQSQSRQGPEVARLKG